MAGRRDEERGRDEHGTEEQRPEEEGDAKSRRGGQAGPRGFQLVDDPEPEPAPGAPVDVPITFASLLLSLSTSALMHLGVTPEGAAAPGGAPRIDLDQARQTIDILEMLRVKTEGNLDADEVRLFETILHDLRMRYVEASRS